MPYNLMNDPNVWVIAGLVFVLGLLIGMFMTAGGRRKWKSRYKDEVANREAWEREHELVDQAAKRELEPLDRRPDDQTGLRLRRRRRGPPRGPVIGDQPASARRL